MVSVRFIVRDFMTRVLCVICMYPNSNFGLLTEDHDNFNFPLLDDVPVYSDASNLTISLLHYNTSDIDGESVDEYAYILPSSRVNIIIEHMQKDVYFVILQVHSYLQNVTLSYDIIPTRRTSVNGTNIGLLKASQDGLLPARTINFYLINDSPFETAFVLVSAQAYGYQSPIPGGCNMEFHVEIAPYFRTTLNQAFIEVDFAAAAPPADLTDSLSISEDTVCDLKPVPVSYDFYHLYLPERDFSIETYFKYIRNMMTVGRVKEHGKLVRQPAGNSPMRRIFSAYSGTGSVFVVVAHTLTTSSVYVPSFTYACDSVVDMDNVSCPVLTTTFSKVFCAVTLFLGLFTCFFGHRYFRSQLFLMGFISGGLASFIFIFHSQTFPYYIDFLLVSLVCGFIFGSICLMLWCCYSVPVLAIFLSTLVLGCVFSSVIFFAITDYFEFLENNINFWTTFGSIVLIVPIILLSLAEKANIVACSLLGAYATIIPIDYYIGSNLKYIIINIIRRATVDKFKTAIIDPPFQVRDAALVGIWLALAISGARTQFWLQKGKAPFPQSPNLFQKIITLRRRRSDEVSERSPLLNNHYPYDAENGYNSSGGRNPQNPYREIFGSF